MQLLRELFGSFLVEEWGNLKFIEPKLMKVFVSSYSKNLHSDIGRNSPILKVTVKNATKAFNELSVNDAIGLMFYVGENENDKANQIFAVARQWTGGSSSSSEWNIALRSGFLTSEDRNILIDKTKISGELIQPPLPGIKYAENVKEADMRALMLRVMKSADTLGKQGNFIIIKKDVERPITSKNVKKIDMECYSLLSRWRL